MGNFIKKCIVFIFVLCLFNCVKVKGYYIAFDAEFDPCIRMDYYDENDVGDGYYEKWYELFDTIYSDYVITSHIKRESYKMAEIKYCIVDTYMGTIGESASWSDIGTYEVQRFFNGIKSSIEKWDKIYVYITDDNGRFYKQKLVNIKEVSSDEANVLIYPRANSANIAGTWVIDSEIYIDSMGVYHSHCNKYAIGIDVVQYRELSLSEKNVFLQRTGAHEVGHILGLEDIDQIENGDRSAYYHHEEVLMGYSKNKIFNNRQSEITYKDIAGVMIALGYHLNEDHIWLYDGKMYDNKYKLICSICNCVKYVDNTNDYLYYYYESCNGIHSLSSGNMIPVACSENYDYYKCGYCRYVAPYDNRVTQNNSYRYYNNESHVRMNDIDGLEYNVYEPHNVVDNVCVNCNVHIHDYEYQYYDFYTHKCICVCGFVTYENHYILLDDNYGYTNMVCIDCLGYITLNDINSYVLNTNYSLDELHRYHNYWCYFILVDEKEFWKYKLGLI